MTQADKLPAPEASTSQIGTPAMATGKPRLIQSPPFKPTPDEMARFVDALKTCGTIEQASLTVWGQNHKARLQRLMQVDSVLRREVESALGAFGAQIFDVLRREVIEGQRVPLTYKGGLVTDDEGQPVYVTKRSDRLLLTLARRHHKDLQDVSTIETRTAEAADGEERFSIRASELALLSAHQLSVLKSIMLAVNAAREADRLDSAAIDNALMPPALAPDDAEIIDGEFTELNPGAAMPEASQLDPWETQP